jgi:hypothetical protein
VRSCDDIVAKDDDSSYREFINAQASLGFSQRFGHEVGIATRHTGDDTTVYFGNRS